MLDVQMYTEPVDAEDVGSTLSDLLARLQSSDPEAWRQLVREYGPLVYRWCRQARVAPEDAADVGQEVFRAVALAVGRLRHGQDGDTFRGWLWTITRNKLRDHARRQAVRPRTVGGVAAQLCLNAVCEAWSSGATSPADRGELAGFVDRGLESIRGEFEGRTWQAFWRVAVESEFPCDVAADLGMTANAVRKAKSRVLARLRVELGEISPDPRGTRLR